MEIVFIYQMILKLLEDVLAPIRGRRHYYEERILEVYEILRKGTEDANKCNEVVRRLENNMRINYFDDKELINGTIIIIIYIIKKKIKRKKYNLKKKIKKKKKILKD